MLSHMINVRDGRRTRYRSMDKTLLHYTTLSIGISLKRVAASQAPISPKRANSTVLKRYKVEKVTDNNAILMERMAA